MAGKPRPYIDFKLYLTRPSDAADGCQTALLPTPEVGETITPITVAAEHGPSPDLLPYLAGKSITLRQLVQLGKGLANWLLPEETVRPLFTETLKRVGNEGGLRLRLIIADHELKQWPWEYVYFDPLDASDSMRGFLALEPRLSVVRHEPLPIPHPEPTPARMASGHLRLLVAAASPHGYQQLQLNREVSAIQEAVKDFNLEGIQLTADPVLLNATPFEVTQALRGPGSAFIFHFVGHGTTKTMRDPFTRGATKEEGYLFFIGNQATQSAEPVKADDLARYLQQAGVRLAVMGACHSGHRDARYPWDGVAGALAARGIPAIIAMQFEVIDALAIKFSRAFYSSLVSGLSLDEAMSFGRLAMYEETAADLDAVIKAEWGVPVLYSRLSNGIIMPELADRETATAKQIRMVIQQAVDTIADKGEVIGFEGNISAGSYNITQKVTTVKGEGKLSGAQMNLTV
jgi:hypothetical protein